MRVCQDCRLRTISAKRESVTDLSVNPEKLAKHQGWFHQQIAEIVVLIFFMLLNSVVLLLLFEVIYMVLACAAPMHAAQQ